MSQYRLRVKSRFAVVSADNKYGAMGKFTTKEKLNNTWEFVEIERVKKGTCGFCGKDISKDLALTDAQICKIYGLDMYMLKKSKKYYLNKNDLHSLRTHMHSCDMGMVDKPFKKDLTK